MNKEFLKFLSNKLKTGNLRSIHLNALPGSYATRLDVKNLDIIDSTNRGLFDESNGHVPKSDSFLFQHILSENVFQFPISLENVDLNNKTELEIRQLSVLEKRLNALHSENEDNYLEHGIQTFGFGFPFLIKKSSKDPSKVIKAPLIIWNLDIERSHAQRNQWIIKKHEDSSIYFNEVLISHLKSDDNIIIQGLSEDALGDGVIDENEMVKIVDDTLRCLDPNAEPSKLTLRRCNDVKEINDLTAHKPWIMWSGVFGLFRTQKQSIIKDTDKLLEEFDNFDFHGLKIERFLHSPNSSVEVDPSQVDILKTLDSSEYKVIQGPPGTGKSQSLTAIISNVLESGGKLLVVCEKKTALDVINNNLQIAGLGNLVALIEDVNRDRKTIVDKVRKTDAPYISAPFNPREYDRLLQEYSDAIGEYDGRNNNLSLEVFDGMSFHDLLAEYLRTKRIAEKYEDPFAETKFDLVESEFVELKSALRGARDLFLTIDKACFAFELIEPSAFAVPFSTSSKNEILRRVESEIEFVSHFDFGGLTIDRVHLEIPQISADSTIYFDFDEFRNLEAHAKSSIGFWQTLLSEFKVADQFITCNSILGKNSLYESVDSLATIGKDMMRVCRYFESLNNSVSRISEAMQKLPPSTTIDTGLTYQWTVSMLRFLGGKYRTLYEFWNVIRSENALMREFDDESLSTAIRRIKTFIETCENGAFHSESLLRQLEACIANQDVLRDYFRWHNHFESLSPIAKGCLTKLMKYVDVDNWLPTFTFQYYLRLLEKFDVELENFNESGTLLARISELEIQLRDLQRYKILSHWNDKRLQAISDYNQRENIQWLFNYRKNSKYTRKNSLRAIVHKEFDLFTTIFPVLLVTPGVSSSILPLKPAGFDVVLFDEASQLRLEDTYASLVRGRVKVISGDRHQMPPSSYFSSDISLEASDDTNDDEDFDQPRTQFDRDNPLFLAESESLLEFGNNLNPRVVTTSHLDFHYRSKHPHLIDFSNAAFYGSRLIPMPEPRSYKSIKLHNVNGIYSADHTNREEAEHVVRFIKHCYPKDGGDSYPSLGIATFNIQQRNLIKDLIHEETYKDRAFQEMLDKINEKEEWFVKNLENIQGDERDVIIISTTFGLNSEGKFRQSFGPLNTSKGHRLLNVIITRAKKNIVVFTSIPEDHYTAGYHDVISTKGNSGKAVLYAYLDYCKAVGSEDENRRLEILHLMRQGCEDNRGSSNTNFVESPFEQEVLDYLSPHIRSNRIISQYQMGGFRIDFVILNEQGNPTIAIECDGAKWHSGLYAYSYDLHRQRILEKQGLRFFRIWSKSWFPNPDREIQKLLKFIKKVEPAAII